MMMLHSLVSLFRNLNFDELKRMRQGCEVMNARLDENTFLHPLHVAAAYSGLCFAALLLPRVAHHASPLLL